MRGINERGRPSIADPRDVDPQETMEWCDALRAVAFHNGPERVRWLLDKLVATARVTGIAWQANLNSPYVNTIPVDVQPPYPGDLAMEEHLASLMRWNALAMVIRANEAHGELGGHIASYASAADLFEVGFNHFFRAPTDAHAGDLVFFQAHSAPGVYARAFMEGRLQEIDLAHYRQEISSRATGARGLSSYPHPWLMPDFWQFPTGSMGIGPISSIYQARFMRYLSHRGLLPLARRRVWGVFGDGEMDEPESLSALTLAAREGLDNLTWIVNCNLQRLDGPVRGNGRIVDELEALFVGAGWNVIKLLWGTDWDSLFARDKGGSLAQAFSQTVDGALQSFAAKDGAFNRQHFFGQNPALAALVEGLTDSQIDQLRRGGHDMVKIHAAYAAAVKHSGQPTVILAQTKKGFGMGDAGQGRMTTHQQKKLDRKALIAFRDRFALPLSDEQAAALTFYRPEEGTGEYAYLKARRDALGGSIPHRLAKGDALTAPKAADFASFALHAAGKDMSTTMAFVRILTNLLKDAVIGKRIVPIVADEARTFGMANLFKQIGIYSSVGQRYEPEDHGSVLSYREADDGQILEEGICEAGAISSWVAAATSHSVHGIAMLPFYIFYSMFGFQRIGDLIWAAADQRARGFLIGATSGRTTLGGEGLQHQDGHSVLLASTVPNCRTYDIATAGELAVVIAHGMAEMLEQQNDVFYYVTALNENVAMPSIPDSVEADIIKGLYSVRRHQGMDKVAQVRILGSGGLLNEALAAAQLLVTDWEIECEVFSATSYSELSRDVQETERWNRLHPGQTPRQAHLQKMLQGAAPIVAVTDYVRAWPLSIGDALNGRYVVLGTDGFGRSDTRQALRRFFEVDRHQIVLAALHALAQDGEIDPAVCAQAIERYSIDSGEQAPWRH